MAEIERLRAENAALAERVAALAAHDVARSEGGEEPALRLEGDPEALRKQVEAFIEAIDRMLAVSGAPDDASSSDEAPSESAG